MTLVHDQKIWLAVNNETLVSALLHCFTGLDWSGFPEAELLLVRAAIEHPNQGAIALSILESAAVVPRGAKLLITALKVGSITDWQSSVNRAECAHQLTVLDALISLASTNNVAKVAALISPDELRYLLVMAPCALATRTFGLMTRLSMHLADYMTGDEVMQCVLVSLAREKSIWTDLATLTTGDRHFRSEKLRRPDLLPLLLMLVWSLGLQICRAKLVGNTAGFGGAEQSLDECCDFFNRCVASIVADPEALAVVVAYFPLILNHGVLVCEDFDVTSTPSVFPVIPHLRPGNMSDAGDPLWNDISVQVKFRACGVPLQPKLFLTFLLGIALEGTDLGTILDGTDLNAGRCSEVVNWIAESPLFGFITNFALHSLSSTRALILGEPFFNHFIALHFVPALLGRFLRLVTVSLSPSFILVDVLGVVAACAPFVDAGAADIIVDFLAFGETVLAISGPDNLDRYSVMLVAVCISILSGAGEEGRSVARQVFLERPSLMRGKRTVTLWFPVLRALFGGDIPDMLMNALLSSLNLADREMIFAAELDLQQLKDVEKGLPIAPKRSASLAVYEEASFAITRCRYIAMCKHYLLAEYFTHVMA
jgi:hypothetical protein